MKKLFLVCCIAFAAMVICSSCSSDNKEGTHKYIINFGRSRVENKQAYDQIMAEIGKDPYFSSQPQYTGKFYDCTEKAIEEFKQHCNALDKQYICSLLTNPFDDRIVIDFWSCDPLQNWISVIFTPDMMDIRDGEVHD